MPHHLDMAMAMSNVSHSKRKCVPIKPPIPSKFQGDIDKFKDAQIPEFNNLVNFPGHMSNKPCPNVPEGMRCCVMCGQACPCSTGGKNKKSTHASTINSNNTSKAASMNADGSGSAGDNNAGVVVVAPLGDSTGNNNKNNKIATSVSAVPTSLISAPTMPPSSASCTSQHPSNYANIPTQNKGLCTICDVNVWIVTSTGLEIKWCKGCKNFRPWAAFGDKGLATKCVRCRERQREKYALQKEEKEKARGMNMSKAMTMTRHNNNVHHQHNAQQQVRQVAAAGIAGTSSSHPPATLLQR